MKVKKQFYLIFSLSQILFGFLFNLLVFLVPDIAKLVDVSESKVYYRLCIYSPVVILLCFCSCKYLNFSQVKGFILANLLHSSALFFLSFGLSETNRSPLLYIYFYLSIYELSYIFSTAYSLAFFLSKYPEDQKFYRFLIASYVTGSLLSPFIGYMLAPLSLPLLFLVLSFVQLAFSLVSTYFLYSDILFDLPFDQIQIFPINRPFLFDLLLQASAFFSITYISSTVLHYLTDSVGLSDMKAESLFTLFKVSFILSLLSYPLAQKLLLSSNKDPLFYGYLVTSFSYFLLSRVISQDVLPIYAVSITLLGISSTYITIPAFARVLQSTKYKNYFHTALASCAFAFLGKMLGCIVAEYSNSSGSFSLIPLSISFSFLALSWFFYKFLRVRPKPSNILLEDFHSIEMTVNLNDYLNN